MKNSMSSPLTVMMPALNSARWLPAHLESVRAWADLAAEIIVVDSASTDGTVELIRAGLPHPNLRVLQHPRGLYQSWNFGLQQVRTKYVYISTVGDAITRAGLEHLLAVAEKFNSDVVLSRPRAIAPDDSLVPDEGHWPLQRLLTALAVTEPRRVPGLAIWLFALLDIPGGILGSSASNLYRATVVQRSAFPTGYGITGDAAWGINNAFACNFAVTPEIFSKFRHHPKAYSAQEYAVPDLDVRLFQLVAERLEKTCATDDAVRAEAERFHCHELAEAVRADAHWRHALGRARKQWWPWIFNPAAWQARAQRNAVQPTLRTLRETLITHLAQSPPPDGF
jgi:hypothetical protein